MFEKGITQTEEDKEHNEQCACGIARSSLKTGDIRRYFFNSTIMLIFVYELPFINIKMVQKTRLF